MNKTINLLATYIGHGYCVKVLNHHKQLFYKVLLLSSILLSTDLSSHKGWTSAPLADEKNEELWHNPEPPRKIQKVCQADIDIRDQELSVWGITADQLDELFATSTDYVALADTQYYYRLNSKWTDVLGWTAEEMTARPFLEFVHPEDIAATSTVASQLNSSICTINFKDRHRAKDGTYHLIEWFTLQQVSGSDRRMPILAIGKDLTLEQQAIERTYALQQAEAATRLKSSFVAHMSHEIRTPLNGIMGFLSLALEEQLPETARHHLTQAQTSSHFLLGVANDIIDVSKIEAGVLKIDTVDFNPRTAIDNVTQLLRPQASKKNLTLRAKISPNIPTILLGDENRLKQILINLIGNAIKFTFNGSISVKVKGQVPTDSTTQFLLAISVKDTGIGIDPQFIPQLFQPFAQVDHAMRRQFGGAGLGLYISRQLCERLGGTLGVLSKPGSGSKFHFHVMLRQPDRHVVQHPETLALPEVSLSVPITCAKILVVEDNLMNQKVVSVMLKKLGHEVDLAINGQKGLEAVAAKQYDLILMDGEMPVMDGLEATQQIRKKLSKDQLPIVGLSAHAMSTHRDRFIAAGMNGYLSKPLHKEALVQELAKWLIRPTD